MRRSAAVIVCAGCGFLPAWCGAQAGGPRAEAVPQSAAFRSVQDPIDEEITTFRANVRQMYNSSQFDELEKIAAKVRRDTFGNGSWKIVQYYSSLECRSSEPEGMWRLHDRIHRDWIAKKPDSITARLAYADFFCSYAWHARGNGFAGSVTSEGWQLFHERLASAQKTLDEARKLKEKDPYFGLVALRVALGEGPSKAEHDALVSEAHAAEPKFWGYFTSRAYSLMPRWHGEPGDWEAFALKSANLPDGLGAELYARIVLHLMDFYGDIFVESDASWPKTREGLNLMMERYPDSLEIANEAAMLAVMAKDRDLARKIFARINGACVVHVWHGPERFLGAQKWAQKSE
jgi:hypothetical protein